MQAIIAKDGTVANLEAVSGHPLLLEAALDAVRQWRYQPLIQNGEPVEVATTIDLAFTLTTDPAPVYPESAEGGRKATASTPPPAAAPPPPPKSAPAPARTSPGATPPVSTPASTAAPSPAPAKPVPPPAPSKTPPSTSPPASAAPSGPPSLYSDESKAALRIVAPGLPTHVELTVFMGDTRLLRLQPDAARHASRDVSADGNVPPGQRTFRVVLSDPRTGAESHKTVRGQIKSRGSHTLEIEFRGTDDNGLPRFHLKLK
jgi:hypothetical protein